MSILNLKNIFDKIQIKDKKITNVLIWVVVGIIMLIVMSGFGGEKKNKTNEVGAGVNGTAVSGTAYDAKEYTAALEKQMAAILSNINGAGKVSVMVTLENGGERVVAIDIKSTEQSNKEGGTDEENKKNSYNVQREDKVVLYGRQSSEEQPLVLKEIMPKVMGVLVLAEGAGDNKVKFELYEAAKAISGAPPHRVKVVNSKGK